ncbi:MAG: TonB-dependent receptor [Caulobacteraceae bacterium]
MRHLFQCLGVLVLGIAASVAVSPTFAQVASSAASPSTAAPAAAKANQSTAATASATEVATVVVTARKTAEIVANIPATITAVTAAQLKATGPINGTGDLLRAIPGVRFNGVQSPNLSEISIRGSGTERATGADSGVGLFVNGAYVGSSTLSGRNFKDIDFFDLDMVEVLEGPQGALYGRNSEYGTVNVVLAKPLFSNSGYLNESYTGGLEQNQLTGVVNYALSDDFAMRLGAESIGQSKGLYYNPDSNEYWDKTEGWLARAQIRYRHGPLDVDLLVDAQDLTLPTFATDEAIPPGASTSIPLGYTNNNLYVIPSDALNNTEQREQRSMLLANLDLGWGTLTSTTMYSHSDTLQWFGGVIDVGLDSQLKALGEAGAYPFSDTNSRVEDKTFYEDIHLTGKAFDGALNWLVGGEVLDQHDVYQIYTTSSPCPLTAKSGICTGTPTAPVCDLLLPTSTPCPTPFPLQFGTVSLTPTSYLSEAAYGLLRYTFRKFTLSGEFRYTDDHKTGTQYSTKLYTGVQINPPDTFRFSAGTPSFTITGDYKLPTPWADMIYAKVGTGYRAGGVNNGISSPFAPVPYRDTYGDENTVSYEAGFKGDVGSHVYVTFDGYFSSTDNAITSINDLCSTINACGIPATYFNINAGTVHAHGLELAVDGHFNVAGGRLNVALNGANQHATYVSANGTYVGLPLVGSPVAQTPTWTGSVTLDYFHQISEDVDGFVHVVYNGQSGGGQDAVTSVAPFVPLASINDVSLRTGFDYRKLEIAFFVQNLTNERIKLLQLGATVTSPPTAIRYNQPRTVGVNVVYHW